MKIDTKDLEQFKELINQGVTLKDLEEAWVTAEIEIKKENAKKEYLKDVRNETARQILDYFDALGMINIDEMTAKDNEELFTFLVDDLKSWEETFKSMSLNLDDAEKLLKMFCSSF